MVKFNPQDGGMEEAPTAPSPVAPGRQPNFRKDPGWEDEKAANAIRGDGRGGLGKKNLASTEGITATGLDAHARHIPHDVNFMYLLVNDALHRETFMYYKEEDETVLPHDPLALRLQALIRCPHRCLAVLFTGRGRQHGKRQGREHLVRPLNLQCLS